MDEGRENALNGLLKRYQNQDDDRLSNESLIRQSFIDPFLEHVLGWDVRDPEVCRPEETRAGRRMDYVFYEDGLRLFVVEAKAATRELFDDDQSYQQALEYAFNADLPFVILTNFRQWIVLSPKIAAQSARGRELFRIDLLAEDTDLTKLIHFSKDRWFSSGKDALYGLLARHTPQAPVDKMLLDDLSKWREILLANLRRRMPDDESWESEDGRIYLESELQRYLDRLIFICYCEDKELANPELHALARQKRTRHNGRAGWLREAVGSLFEQYRTTFNSDLFDQGRPDRFPFDDAKIEEVISGLRESRTVQNGVKRPPYDFAKIPADILGRVYENFIGHIQQAVGRGFRESEDKSKRKKEGIYYTPQYIVDEIVNETIKPKIKGKSFDEISSVRIVDPACGSGSFLIRAYDALLSEAERALKRKPTYAERKQLLRCIYGVDLDDRAIQVTKLNLALRMAERGKQLPRLDDTIRHGNSLVADPDIAGFSAFRWEEEFPEVFSNGGFDVVLGNPPYIRIQTLKSNSPEQVAWLNEHYESGGRGNYDIYVLFVERGLSILREGGALGYILPHKFFNAKYGMGLRQVIAEGKNLSKIVHFGDEQVFSGATTYTCLLFLEQKPKRKVDFVKVDDLEAWRRTGKAQRGKIGQAQVTASEWNFVIGPAAEVFEKLSKMPSLGEVCDIYVGLQTSADDVFIVEEQSQSDDVLTATSAASSHPFELELAFAKPLISGAHVRRYAPIRTQSRVIFPYQVTEDKARLVSWEELLERAPRTAAYLDLHKSRLQNREKGKMKGPAWYGYVYRKNMTRQEVPKLCVPRLVDVLYCAMDLAGEMYLDNVDVGGVVPKSTFSVHDLRYVGGLINSSILKFVFPLVSATFRGGWLSANKQFLSQLPIRTIDFSDPEEKKMHDLIVELVDHMLDLHKQLEEANGPMKERIEKEIERTDRKIDDIVYRLYDISDEERRIIES